MTANCANTDAWEIIPGADELRSIYGYWPTLHDAIIYDFSVSNLNSNVQMSIEYEDLVNDGSGEVVTSFDMDWVGVTSCKLRLMEPSLYGVTIQHVNGLYLTTFVPYEWGCDGTIEAQSIQFSNIERLPERQVSSGLRIDVRP
ncbi:MAG TPA: hypothetical protein VGK19_04335 [Capsulimonadaceae bacterium]|jgi:hypothetical protein